MKRTILTVLVLIVWGTALLTSAPTRPRVSRNYGMGLVARRGVVFPSIGILAATTVTSAPNYVYMPPAVTPVIHWESVYAPVPNTTTDPVVGITQLTGDIHIEEVAFTNTSGANCLVTIQDQQPTPQTILKALIPLYDAATPQANNYFINMGNVLAKGGVKWVACDGTSISGYIRVTKGGIQ